MRSRSRSPDRKTSHLNRILGSCVRSSIHRFVRLSIQGVIYARGSGYLFFRQLNRIKQYRQIRRCGTGDRLEYRRLKYREISRFDADDFAEHFGAGYVFENRALPLPPWTFYLCNVKRDNSCIVQYTTESVISHT